MAYNYNGYQPYGGYGYTPGYGMQNYAQAQIQTPQYGQPSMAQNPQLAYVNGIEGAKAYIIAPNSSVVLMDSDNPLFYIKSANQMGQMSMRTFRFSEVTEGAPKPEEAAISDYVRKDDLKALQDNIIKRIDELKTPIAAVKEEAHE